MSFRKTKVVSITIYRLDYKGLSKKDKSTVLEYMEKTEFKDHSKVKDITNKSEAFIQGKYSDLKIK